MRVLLVTDWVPDTGGAETYAQLLRGALAAAGDEVRLLTSSAGTAADGTADFVALGSRRPSAQALLQIANPLAAAKVHAACRAFRPDVALVHQFAYHLSPAVFASLRGVPTVLTVLDYKIICPLGSKLLPDGAICDARAGLVCWQSGCVSMPHWLRDQPRYALIRAALRRVTTVIACSRHVQTQLLAEGINSVQLTLPAAEPGPAFTNAPAPYPVFVYCGRLNVEKGVALLLRAFARLRTEIADARLQIVGDGPQRRELERSLAALGVADAVTFTGWLSQADVGRKLADAWALVAPSLWAEPFGQMAIDAMVRGVPVVASSAGGFGETVEDGVSGLLFPNGDERALVECLRRIARGEVFPARTLGHEVVQRVHERHSLPAHVARLRTILEAATRSWPS